MTVIKANCPVDGVVELGPADISLVVCTSVPIRSYYSFTCPKCADTVRKRADDHVITLLVSGGVVVTPLDIPAEALEPHEGPAISYDDLLEFHEQLENISDHFPGGGDEAGRHR